MDILIRKEPNNSIYIDKNSADYFDTLQMDKPPYNFKKIKIDDKYSDCESTDFDLDLNFNLQKYENRKQREINITRIEDLKKSLKNTDYIALKAFEGSISEAEFEQVKKQREEWRKEVDALLKQI